MSEEEPVELDRHRGSADQIATEIRRRHAEVEADQSALLSRRAEFEKFLASAPAAGWTEAAEKARYLINLLAGTSVGRDPRRQALISAVLADFDRLAARDADRP